MSPAIDWLNTIIPFRIQRVIDYTDYWALLELSIAHKMLNGGLSVRSYRGTLVSAARLGVAGIAFFAVCATTVPLMMETPKGTMYIGKTYTIKKSKEEVIKMIRSLGYNVDREVDSTEVTVRGSIMPYYYQTDNIVIYDDGGKLIDTILNVKYTLNGWQKNTTDIRIINVTLTEDGQIQKWQTLKFLSKQYRKALNQSLIRKLKQ